jgi:pimeloyl-ACP methyl ester carboxylesterase
VLFSLYQAGTTSITKALRALALACCTLFAAAHRGAASDILDLPVVFDVVNTNTSRVPCSTDAAPYQIRGHLVAPAEVLEGSSRAVTLYLHGGASGEWWWRFRAVAGYDYATEMAKLGHASVVIDRLGFDESDHPNGFMTCNGGEADVYAQVLRQLRSGDYVAGNTLGPVFERTAVAGHSEGGWLSQILAYSYPDVLDAVVVMGWLDAPATSTAFTLNHGPDVASEVLPTCLRGGEPSEHGQPGYTDVTASPEVLVENVFYNVDPAVVTAVKPLFNRDPCGVLLSAPQMLLADNLFIATISVPVLLVFGDHDLFSVEDGYVHSKRFLSSPDVTLKVIEDTGHGLMLERKAADLRARVSSWLTAHGF